MSEYLWYIIRATGTIAYILMFCSILAALYMQILKKARKRIVNVLHLHETLANWTLILVVFHVGVLLIDQYIPLAW